MQATTQIDAAAAKAAGMDPDRLEQLANSLHLQYVTTGKLPHLRLLVSREERVLLSHISGIARAGGEPLQPDSLFRIASMTKPVTSVAFMMLVEQGLVALDDPVTDILPEFENLSVGLDRQALKQPVRMIDLLRHTSGLTYGLQRNIAGLAWTNFSRSVVPQTSSPPSRSCHWNFLRANAGIIRWQRTSWA